MDKEVLIEFAKYWCALLLLVPLGLGLVGLYEWTRQFEAEHVMIALGVLVVAVAAPLSWWCIGEQAKLTARSD